MFAAYRELMLISMTISRFPDPFWKKGKRKKKKNKPPIPLNPRTGITPKGTLSSLTNNTKDIGKGKGNPTQLKMNKPLR